MAAIRWTEDLKREIDKAISGDRESLYDIATFKLYNYYINTHILPGSDEDNNNAKLFNELEENYPEVHEEIN
jgi:hypothetical protein